MDPELLAFLASQIDAPDAGPFGGGGAPPPMMPPEEDYGPNYGAVQQPIPNDYWSRVALGGAQFQAPRVDPNAAGSGLAALAALLGGFAQSKTNRAARGISEVEQRNARAREAAKTLASHRHEMRNMEYKAAQNRANTERLIQGRKEVAEMRPDPADPLVRVQQPDGSIIYVRRSQAEGKPAPEPVVRPMTALDPSTGQPVFVDPRSIGGSGVTPVQMGRKTLSTSERNAITNDLNLINQVDDIRKLYRPEFVGLLEGTIKSLPKTKLGKGLRPGEAKFRSAVAQYNNRVRNQIFGSALTKTEKDEMVKELPVEGNPPEVFEANLAKTQENLRRLARTRRETYEATGLDLSRVPPIPLSDDEARAIFNQVIGRP